MKVIGIIPARGGSKGVKDKNIRDIDGKELISYTIAAAKNSIKLSKFIVSTDSEQIASVSKKYGADVLKRPEYLATDTAKITDVISQVLFELEKKDEFYDLIILLQPTSPLRSFNDIDNVIRMFESDMTVDSIISVVEMNEIHPARMYNIDKHGELHSLQQDFETVHRQSLSPIFYRNGCIYGVRTNVFKKEKAIMTGNKKAYVMPTSWLLNVDKENDFVIGEHIVRLWKRGEI